MLVAALLSAYAQFQAEMKRLDLGDEDDASSIVVACGIGGILGGKIYYAMLYRDWHLIFDRAGIVWYGCLLLGAAVFVGMARRRGLPLARTFDAAGPSLALGYAVGRVGCFLVGDDYGKPTDLPWGVAFKVGLPRTTAANLRDHFGIEPPPGVSGSDFVAVHPTQLYETGLALLIWGALLFFARRYEPRPGRTFLLALALLSVERFGIEFLRAKDDRFFGDFTLAQVISLAILGLVGTLAVVLRHRAGKAKAPA